MVDQTNKELTPNGDSSGELVPVVDSAVENLGPTKFDTPEYKAERILKRDNTRKWLAGGAITHLVLLEVIIVAVLWDKPEELANLLHVLITTASSITAIVIGFYFGQSDDD